ncbi:Uncharacterized protein FWK35_00012890 [Aphis craccivora]|uniref:Uncharacterized protein n=1 Tax=Aphis craccivora TaxID=307492 RepID=A0A6G0YP85_APHCR|nr:Uncharacterized protein FWK35_00012890 [Aphis craccivora]
MASTIVYILDPEPINECIDSIMMFVFVSVYSIARGGIRWEYPWCIIEVKSKHFLTVFKKTKSDGKRESLRNTSFRPNRFY